MEYLQRIDVELERCNEQLVVQSLHCPMLSSTKELDTLLNEFLYAHESYFANDVRRQANQFEASISGHEQRQQPCSYQLTIEQVKSSHQSCTIFDSSHFS